MSYQTELPCQGGVSANIASMGFKTVKVEAHMKRMRAYVETMHRAGRKLTVIRIKPDELRAILRELNKGRSERALEYVAVHWDGVPVVA